MSARTYRRLPQDFEEHAQAVRPSWRNLGEWVRAWRIVMRDPDKTIPSAGLPPEGDPIPADLELHCPGCGYELAGLRIWRCPECGQPFNPHRVYTLEMLKQPEYFLRYRYGPEDIRRTFLSFLLLMAGLLMVAIGTLVAAKTGTATSWMAVKIGLGMLSGFACLTVPIFILIHFAADIPWPRVFWYFAWPWFILCVLWFSAFIF